jgi:hypothetical protein
MDEAAKDFERRYANHPHAILGRKNWERREWECQQQPQAPSK